MSKDKYKNLSQLLGAYFHQDCFATETPDQIVERFRTTNTIHFVRSVINDIDHLLSVGLSEDDLEEELASMGCEYYLPADGHTPSLWLRAVRETLLLKGKEAK